MLIDLKKQLQSFLQESLKVTFPSDQTPPKVELDTPLEKIHGEFSCNIALRSAKIFKKSPLDIAHQFMKVIEQELEKTSLKNKILKIEIKAPGFINFFLSTSALYEVLYQVFKEDTDYGKLDLKENQKIQIEFVSANPTGPLSVAHARQAAVGDALGNILDFIGFNVTKEFYVNDEGNQINILGTSIKCRANNLLGGSTSFPEDGYQGDYIIDMAQEFIDQHKIKTLAQLEEKDLATFSQFGVDHLLAIIKKELNDFGVVFDVWSHQSKIATQKNIEKVLGDLQQKGFLYDKDGALWFRTTDFGDDKDRVVKKSDGSYTYLTPDIVYHKDKFERGFSRIINIWGPDHHGYIPRIKAAAEALGRKKDDVHVLIVQLATIFRDGKAVSMSTRRGQYISMREVMSEVGVDAARFFFLMRHTSAHLEFDLDLAKKQTPENPVYYIQYAHARVYSVFKKAKEICIKENRTKFSLLKTEEELDLIKKIGAFPDVLTFCHDQLDPYPLVSYLQELATCFHKFYDQHRVIDEQNKDLSAERLGLIDATRIVLANGLRLLGVSQPKQM